MLPMAIIHNKRIVKDDSDISCCMLKFKIAQTLRYTPTCKVCL